MLAFIKRAAAPPDDAAFAPGWERIDAMPAGRRSRIVLHLLLAFGASVAAWTCLAKLDVVVVADGRLAPRTQVRLVQPVEAGVVREVLVAEGAAVVEGEPLVRLDGALVESETRALRSELARRDLQRRRIDAELAGVAPQLRRGDDESAHAATLALFRANRRAHLDAAAQEAAAVARLDQELLAARAAQDKLDRVVPIVRTAAERFAKLRAEGFVSELAALEREREAIEKSQDLDAQRHAVAGLASASLQARTRLAQVASGYRAQLQAERAQVDAEIARIGEALARQFHRAEAVEIRAPCAGTVKEVFARGPGAVIAAGSPLVTIVPAGEELVAEVLVHHEDAGFVQVGQLARVKLAPYPFQKYGALEGRVAHVAPDAIEPAADRSGSPGFRARIALAGQALRGEGAAFELVSGMLATAEIRLGERRVIEYLLSPLQKAWGEAARER
ncbi:MAG: HlyD family type I secretion periplasmic adaptor subunit [Burkholderiales bacterium]|jgi:HlyD family secretion protein|nr:HlyD family type I secretion periplasmic adaptor subunit [Burkholderiales bacterium]